MAIDVGLDGNDAPAQVGGLPWRVWLGVEARLKTLQGRQIMRPGYGLDLSARIGRNLDGPDYRDVRRRVEAALDGLLQDEPSINVRTALNSILVGVTVGNDD